MGKSTHPSELSTAPNIGENPEHSVNPVHSMTPVRSEHSVNPVHSMTPVHTEHLLNPGFPSPTTSAVHFSDQPGNNLKINSKGHSAEILSTQGHFQRPQAHRWQTHGQVDDFHVRQSSTGGHFKHDFVQEHFVNPALPDPRANWDSFLDTDSKESTWTRKSKMDIQSEPHNISSSHWNRHNQKAPQGQPRSWNARDTFPNMNKTSSKGAQPKRPRDFSINRGYQQPPTNYQSTAVDSSGFKRETVHFTDRQIERMDGDNLSNTSAQRNSESVQEPIKRIKLSSNFLQQ